jgi:hypothetical protein
VHFSIATWNVLARQYEQWVSHPEAESLLSTPWPTRAAAVLRCIDGAGFGAADDRGSNGTGGGRPSLLCLQELDEFEAQYRAPLEQMGYECLYTSRSGVHDGPALASEAAEDETVRAAAVAAAAAAVPEEETPSPVQWAAQLASKRGKHDGALIAWQRDQFELDEDEEEGEGGEEEEDSHSGVGRDGQRAPATKAKDGKTSKSSAIHRVDYDDLAFADAELARRGLSHLGGHNGGASSSSYAEVATASASVKLPTATNEPVQPDSRILRHNVGAFVFLRPKGQKDPNLPPLLVACTHLFYNDAAIRVRQLQYLFARIRAECARRLARRQRRQAGRDGAASVASAAVPSASASAFAPVPSLASLPTAAAAANLAGDPLSSFPLLLCGDFNSLPDSTVYRFATEGVRHAAQAAAAQIPDGIPGAAATPAADAAAVTAATHILSASVTDNLAAQTIAPGSTTAATASSSLFDGRALSRLEQLQLASRIAAGFRNSATNNECDGDDASPCVEGRSASLRSAYAIASARAHTSSSLTAATSLSEPGQQHATAGAGAIGNNDDGSDDSGSDAKSALSASLPSAPGPALEPAFTNIDGAWRGCLDYIFFHDPSHAGMTARVQSAEGPASQATSPHAHTQALSGQHAGASVAAAAGGAGAFAPYCLRIGSVRRVTDGSGLDLVRLSEGGAYADADACRASKAPALEAGVEAGVLLPNRVWPSDHLMLMAHCTLTSLLPPSSPSVMSSARATDRERSKL